MKVRLTSLFLATVLAVTSTGCSIRKVNDNKSINNEKVVYETVKDDHTKQMIEFIERIESSDLNLDLSTFYELSKTLKVVFLENNNEKHYNSYYNKDENTIYLNIEEESSFEHELMHVIMNNNKELNNVFLEEGFVELITSEVCNHKNTYRYNVGVLKILTTILGRERILETFNEKDTSIITEGLASIVPAKKDAEEVLSYLIYEHNLCNEMHQDYFNNGNLDKFKSSDNYKRLVNVRKDLTERFKIYIKHYYRNKVYEENINPKEILIEMLSLLDIVDKELFDPDLEIERKNDYFLKEEVSYIMETYNLTSEEYDECYQASKTKKYLYNVTKSNIIKKK